MVLTQSLLASKNPSAYWEGYKVPTNSKSRRNSNKYEQIFCVILVQYTPFLYGWAIYAPPHSKNSVFKKNVYFKTLLCLGGTSNLPDKTI